MLHIAIIGIITAILAVLVSGWNNGKNPSLPTPPNTPTKPNNPGKPNNPLIPQPHPTVTDKLIENPPLLSKNSKGKYELIVAYKLNKLYNPNEKVWDPVLLRGYLTKASLFDKKQAGDAVEDILVGPQIRVKQGETLAINLSNQLPPETEETCPEVISEDKVNEPHCFNTTNLHTHGLWVSPQGNSDNVFLKFKPKEKFDYQFKIEPNHPAGTYWYHAHLHGSTAIHVSSGMVGALIVEGSRTPKMKNGKVTETGDMDILWKEKNTYPNEQILVFQQIQYHTCKDALEPDKCMAGTLESYNVGIQNPDGTSGTDGLANPGSWAAGGYHTSINGKIHGEMKVNQNEFYRWRMIHGGVRDTIGLIIKEIPNSSKYAAEKTIEECSKYQRDKDAFDKLTSLPVHTIAQDGLTMTHAQKRTISVFQPGYRHDAMVAFPTTNKYCIFDTKLNINDEINAPLPTGQMTIQLAPTHSLNAQLLGWVNVQTSKSKAQTPAQFLQERAQKIGLNKEIQTQLAQLNFSAFVDHESLMTSEIDKLLKKRPPQLSRFDIDFFAPTLKFGYSHSDHPGVYSFGDVFKGNNKDNVVDNKYVRKLEIGKIDEWELTSVAPPFPGATIAHPYHIHVNPLQIVSILKSVTIEDPKTKEKKDIEVDVSGLLPDQNDNTPDLDDIQYRGLKGQFKDTILVKSGYRVIARTQYKKFEGDFVQHCHILDHEDQGMMEYVRICGGQFDCNAELPSHHSNAGHGHH